MHFQIRAVPRGFENDFSYNLKYDTLYIVDFAWTYTISSIFPLTTESISIIKESAT